MILDVNRVKIINRIKLIIRIMSSEILVKNCSPTLAGIKTGNLFAVRCQGVETIRKSVIEFNHKLVKKGVRIVPIFCQNGIVLIFVYRPIKLVKDFSHKLSSEILIKYGYNPQASNKCVVKLINRLKSGNGFPHEIGLFLGYPPADVYGFIKNNAKNYKCSGVWKVYENEEDAKKRFKAFKKCTSVYMNILSKDNNCIEKLAVSLKNV